MILFARRAPVAFWSFLHVALLHAPHRVDALLRKVVLREVVNALLTEDDARPCVLDRVHVRLEHVRLLVEEGLHLSGVADADLRTDLRLLDLQRGVEQRDPRVLHTQRHPWVDALLVHDDALDEGAVRHVPA